MKSDICSTHRQIIKNIRSEYSGINKRPRQSLASSIETLAADLYKTDTHFIFEIIQNAEDNKYDDGVSPTLCFKVCQLKICAKKRTVLIVENNETGFEEKHVDAVCAVGKSTKTKTQGYIGEKGIGFKSVFKITSSPYIFSNGFQFSLPEEDKDTGLGYIVPQWCDDLPQGLKKNWTSIVIPLDKNDSDIEKVVSYLKEIAPETILFLEKIKSVKINIALPSKSYEVEIKKEDSKYPLVELQHVVKIKDKREVKSSYYWMSSEVFEKPIDIFSKKRQGINSRSVTIAIPVDIANYPGKLFAYLPVWEKTGLPFLINADFLLVSSREGLHEDEKWNQWLRDCVPIVYEKAFLSCLNAKVLSAQQKVSIYGSIPLDSSETFLEEIVENIQERLGNMASVLIYANNEPQKPENTIITTKRFKGVFIDSKKLPIHLKKISCPVRFGLQKYSQQLKSIGVKDATTNDIISCLEDEEWINGKNISWFIDLYRYLRLNKHPDYKKVTIIPILKNSKSKSFSLVNGSFTPVYFDYTEETQKSLSGLPSAVSDLIPFSFVSKELLSLLDKSDDKDEVRDWMTQSLNIYDFSIENCCVDIINTLKEQIEELGAKDIIETTNFLLENADSDFSWGGLPLLLSDGSRITLKQVNYEINKRQSKVQSIVVPESYDVKKGWQNIWISQEDREHFVSLSNDYPSGLVDQILKKGLIDKYPSPKKRDNGYYDHYVDHLAPSWMLDNTPKLSMSQSASLLEWAKQFIELPNLKYIHRYRPDGRYNFSLKSKGPAQIIKCIKNIPWLPTTKGCVRPSQAFFPRQDIKEIFGDTVPYFEDDLPSEISDLLGVCSEITVDEMLELLKNDSGFTQINIQKIKRIYFELESRTRYVERDLAAEFFDHEIIFVPGKRGAGSWHKATSCVWKDSSDLLGDGFVFLEAHYPKLKSFFVETLGIKEQVDKEFFAKRWLQLQNEKNTETKISLIEHLYREIRPLAQSTLKDQTEWWGDFVSNLKVYTQSNKFECPSEVVVPDDRELKKIFSDYELEFAWRPDKDTFSDWMPFYRQLEIPLLSESVTETLADETAYEVLSTRKFVTDAFVGMAASWLREKRKGDYECLVEESFFEKLLSIKEALSEDSINVTLTLETGEIYETAESECDAYWDYTENILVYRSGVSRRVLAKTLAKALLKNKDFNDFSFWIEITLGEENTERLNDLGFNVPQEVAQLVKAPKKQKERPKAKESDQPKPSVEKTGEPPEPSIQEVTVSKEREPSHSPEQNDDSGTGASGLAPNASTGEEPEFEESEVGNEVEAETESSKVDDVDYVEVLRGTFSRKGQTWFADDLDDEDIDNEVRNPERRGRVLAERFRENRHNEKSSEDRRYTTERSILEGPNPTVRFSLLTWYQGKCQICGKTWPDHRGDPYFIAGYLIERRHASWVDDPANAICFCADHFAQWRHAAKEAPLDIVEQITSLKLQSEGGDGNLSILFTMKGEDCEIHYCEKHILGLRKLIEEAQGSSVSNS